LGPPPCIRSSSARRSTSPSAMAVAVSRRGSPT
jgi:hypothetical protein